MKIRMLLAAARLIALAHPGCAGGAEEGSARTEPVAVTVMESRAPHYIGQEESRNAATSSRAAQVGDEALIKALDNPYSVEGAPPGGLMPMYGALMLQRVSDFESWRSAFEESRAQRRNAGFVAQGMMRGVEDPQLAVVWLAVTDVTRAKQYFADKAIRARLKAAGAIGRAEIGLSSNVVAKMEPGRTGLHAALLRLRAEDVDTFKSDFAAAEAEREAAGIVGYSLGQDVDDEHVLYVYLQSENPAQLLSYVQAKKTKQSWQDAGVRGSPRVVVVKEGELTLCR